MSRGWCVALSWNEALYGNKSWGRYNTLSWGIIHTMCQGQGDTLDWDDLNQYDAPLYSMLGIIVMTDALNWNKIISQIPSS